MQSDASNTAIPEDEDWDEDWDEEDYTESPDSFFSAISLASKMKMAGGSAFVILLLLSSMIFTNFGFYSGAGSLSVLIDVNEGKDPGDKIFDASIMATSPFLGMLKKEGDYSISFDGVKQTSGKFELSEEGRSSLAVDYESFFVDNGAYTLTIEIGSQTSSNSVIIDRFADSVLGSVTSFNGDYPIDKDSPVIINMQFIAQNAEANYINPWVSGTVKVYHYETSFNENKGESYWNDDSRREGDSDNWNLVDTVQFDVNSDSGSYSYSSGGTTDFYEVEIPPYNLNLILDAEKFYGEKGSGDYTLVFEFFNDFGEDKSNKDGRSVWSWFHLCDTKDNGKCKD